MNPLFSAFSIAVSLLASPVLSAQTPAASGPYLGQTLPGTTPVLFAPGIVSLAGRHEYACSFAPDGKAILFTAQEPGKRSMLMMCAMSGEAWASPREIRLGESTLGEMEGFFAPDGKTIHFVAYEETGCAIWKSAKQGAAWGKAQKLSSAINTGIVFYPSLTSEGTLYYTDVNKRMTLKSVPANGEYLSAEHAGLEFGGHAFVSRDERTIVLDAKGDLYASFRLSSGMWSKPRKLGPAINTPEYRETCPSLSPDGRFLFFSRYCEKGEIANLYWVSSAEIDSLRSQVGGEGDLANPGPSRIVPIRAPGKPGLAVPGHSRKHPDRPLDSTTNPDQKASRTKDV
jgi:hypothetical protein